MENIILTNNKDLRLVGVKVGVFSTLSLRLPLVSAAATNVEVVVTDEGTHSAYTATYNELTHCWICDIAAAQFSELGKQSYEVAYRLNGAQYWDGKGWIEVIPATVSGITPTPRPEPYRYTVVSVNGAGADTQGNVRIPQMYCGTDSPQTTEGYIEGDQYCNSSTGATWTLCDVSGVLTWVFALGNYYTKAETDEQINKLAAYYITSDIQGNPFATHSALVNAETYYSGGATREPTRNDYAVVLADETHGGAEYRYIYAIADGAATGHWEAQYPIETNDYSGLANKPSINSVVLDGNKTGAQLGLANATDLTPLQLAALYPEGDVKSASEWATPWNGSTGIKYELDSTTHTAAILTFSKTTNTANDNSHLTGRVVIPPFIESNGERYTVVSIKDHSTGGLPTYDLTEVVAPTTLATIGRFAFYFCMGLKRAYFPRASQLKYNAFQDCRALEYISIPNVSNVPTQCFINDSSLKGLTIPNAESILLGGLSGCTALEFVDFGSVARSAVPTFYNQSFYNVPVTCKIIIPDSQYTAWTTASGWSGLVTAGYEFVKYSDWEAPHRYELATKEDKANKTTSLSAQSTDTQYPSAKCVWDALAGKLSVGSDGTVSTNVKLTGMDIARLATINSGAVVGNFMRFRVGAMTDEYFIAPAYDATAQKYGFWVKNGANDAGTFYALADFAPLASPALTGTPTAPTPTAGDNSTKVATTAFVQNRIGQKLEVWLSVNPQTGVVSANYDDGL